MLFGAARELAACALDAMVQCLPDPPDDVPAGEGSDGRAPHPVLLVHGYGGAKTQWFAVRRALRAAGFGCVRTFDYDARGTDIPTLARRLCEAARALLAETGARRVHLVGHSLGGVIIRHAVTVDGLEAVVAGAVTIASPHGGAPAAWAGVGAVAAQLRPGSGRLREVEAAAGRGEARWLSLSGGLDTVVPPRRARIRPPALGAANVVVPGEGHLSILWSPAVAEVVTSHLHASHDAGPLAGAGMAA